MIVALTALFVALGGVSYGVATGSIDSREIKNSSIRSKDVRNNSLTGADVTRLRGGDISNDSVTGDDVVESSLGQVPSASAADSANTANTANGVGPNGVNTDAIQDNAVTSAKVLDNSLTGSDVNESTLGQVPNAGQLAGKPASAFLASSTYRRESAVGPGTALGDGTHVIAQGCFAGDVLLSGGPANVLATSDLLESFPNNAGTWSARINKNGFVDNFSVVVVCANR
jgi:hypothetical protein